MSLHCATRLGFISYLYQQHQEIAYRIGIIAEIPIAMCSSDYDFGKGLKIENHDGQSLPPIAYMAHEIILFTPAEFLIKLNKATLPVVSFEDTYCAQKYFPLCLDIFHPPCLQA